MHPQKVASVNNNSKIFTWKDIQQGTDVFQRCIIIGLYYFSLKQVNNGKCITAVRGISGHIPV